MPHPNDVALHITLGREIKVILAAKIESLIRKPDDRTAGYIEAIRDVQRIMNGGDDPAPIELSTTHPGA